MNPGVNNAGAILPDGTTVADPNQVQVPVQQSKGNFFTHLLPTVGGILGGIGGELIDPLGGGIAGAAAGSALGKTGENAVEHQGLGSGVLANAIEGGAGQGVGGLLGKVGGKVIGAVGNKAGSVADDLVKGQFTKGALSGEDANTLRTAGITDARQVPEAANIITGSDGALHQGVLRGLSDSDIPADFSDLSRTGKNLVAANQMQLKQSSIPQINQTIQGALIKSVTPEDVTQIATKGASSAPVNTFEPGALKNVTAEKAFDVTKNFEDLAAAARNSAYDKMGNVIDADQLAKSKIFGGLADEARTAAFGGSTPINLTPENKAQIISDLDGLKNINPMLHKSMVDQVDGANSLQDLRGIQAPFVRANQAANATAKAADRGAGTTANATVSSLPLTGAVAGGPHGMMAGLAASMLKSPTADRAAIPLVQKGGSLLSGLGGATVGGASVPGLLGGASGVLTGTSNNLIQNGGTVGDTMQPSSPIDPTTQPSPTGGLSREDLLTLALYSPGALASLTPNAQQTQNVSNAQAAEGALGGLGNAPNGGLLSSLTGKLGIGGTGEYQRAAQSAAQEVANALPGTDAKAIEKELTDYAAGGGNINDAIKALMQRLGSVVQSNQTTGLGGILGVNAGTTSITSQLPMAVQ